VSICVSAQTPAETVRPVDKAAVVSEMSESTADDGVRRRLQRDPTHSEDVPPALQNILELEEGDPRIQQATQEAEMEVYEVRHPPAIAIAMSISEIALPNLFRTTCWYTGRLAWLE